MNKIFAVFATVTMTATVTLAQAPSPQPRPMAAMMTVESQVDSTGADGVVTTTIVSANGALPSPMSAPLVPGSLNELQYIQSNVYDGFGTEMPNTLPSTPSNQFNLHDGPVVISDISKSSPKDDLAAAINAVKSAAQNGTIDQANIQKALDILEGNPIAGKLYSGFALLHYTAGERLKSVTPITDAQGKVIGGNVNIHQIWYDNHIESDTALLDISAVREVPFTVTYTIDVLTGGADDFSPFVMYFDNPALSMPGMPPMPHVAMDATFYPLGEGHRYVLKLKHAPGKYYNLTYTWGWRIHPPRVQATENAGKKVGTNPDGTPKSLVQWETSVFGLNPRSSEASKLAAIAKIGELAPAKRIWQAFRDARTATAPVAEALMADAELSFADWADRTHLPRGVTADPTSKVTLFYANNTIYGNIKSLSTADWTSRGWLFTATLLNGDHFDHAYVNVDFGGSRGWENEFQFGSGPGGSHTFGRTNWWMNTAFPLNSVNVPPVAADGTPTKHKVAITLNYDRPSRIALYQFDPLHHDVAVYSLH
jgi:hypothetical protein